MNVKQQTLTTRHTHQRARHVLQTALLLLHRHIGSWGKDGAGGPCELTRTFCGVDSPSVENARVNLGNVHI